MGKLVNQKSVKCVNQIMVYMQVYDEIQKGNYPSSIAKKLNFTRQYINKFVKPLKDEGIIKKITNIFWKVNPNLNRNKVYEIIKNMLVNQKLSLGTNLTKPSTNLHALQLNFPILKGKVKDSDWEIKEQLKNWIPKYTNLDILGGLTIKNNNNKSITVFARSRDLIDLDELEILCNKIKVYIPQFFKKHNVVFDVMEIKTKNLHLGTEDKQSESMLKKGEKYTLDLKTKCKKILPKDDRDALAWLDGSPFKFTAETNDLHWKREYLSMPFAIRDMKEAMGINYRATQTLIAYQEQISLHLEVEKKQLENQIKMNDMLDKLNNHLNNPLAELKKKVNKMEDILEYADVITGLSDKDRKDFEDWTFKNL